MPRKTNTKHDLDKEPACLHEASGLTKETGAGEGAQQANSNEVLKAISMLHAELVRMKSDICNKIKAQISEVKHSLRGEIATLRTKSDTAMSALNNQMVVQSQTLKELAHAANDASDTIQVLKCCQRNALILRAVQKGRI